MGKGKKSKQKRWKMIAVIMALAACMIAGTAYTYDSETEQMELEGIEKEGIEKEGIEKEEMEPEGMGPEEIQYETEPLEDYVIRISQVHLAGEREYKIYDGTAELNLAYEVLNLPEHLMLYLTGHTAGSDAGIYPMEVEIQLSGEGAENYEIVLEDKLPMVEIRPRPLYIEIADARKIYYTGNSMEELYFENTDVVSVKGFLADEDGWAQIPEGFELPEITLDESRIRKESPMYQEGREQVYKDALILKRRKDGTLTGNPTHNYCFLPDEEEYCRKGSIILTSPYIEEGKAYQILAGEHAFTDRNGDLWIAAGGYLQINPLPGCGFSNGAAWGPLYESGSGEFYLSDTDPFGHILAISQIRSVSWRVDGIVPEGKLIVNGREDDGSILYTQGPVTIQVFAADEGSGMKSVQAYLAAGEECDHTPEELYLSKQNLWEYGETMMITGEGSYRCFFRLEDMVGNISFLASKPIVVDRTPPEILIENVVDGSANKGVVFPVLYAKDENLKRQALSFTLEGFSQGKRTAVFVRKESSNEEMIEIQDFPYEKDWDDVYLLRVSAEDLAGNKTEKGIRFSVNRFGSSYYIEETQWENLRQYYLKKPIDIELHEVNVDYLTENQVLAGWEEEIAYLEKNRDYEVLFSEKEGKKEYIYRIPAAFFQKNGHYYVAFASKDQAQNYSDNRAKQTQIEFAIDTKPPAVLITGIEDGGEYDGTKEFTVECLDNMEVKAVHVSVNGKEAGDGKSSTQKIRLDEAEGWQVIEAMAEDMAGNQSQIVHMRVKTGREKETEGNAWKERTGEESEPQTEHTIPENTEEKVVEANPEHKETDASNMQKALIILGFLAFLKGILWIGKKVN